MRPMDAIGPMSPISPIIREAFTKSLTPSPLLPAPALTADGLIFRRATARLGLMFAAPSPHFFSTAFRL